MNFFRQKNGKICMVLGLFILIIFTAGCSQKQPTAKAAVAVTVGKVTTKSMPINLDSVGNVAAYNSVTILPQVTGQVANIHFQQGQNVKAGDLLITINPAPFQQQLAQAEALLAHDRAQASFNRVTANRYTDLYQQGAVAKQDNDQMATASQTQDATVSQDEAAVENARINLSHCYITSPIDGRTGAFLANLGALATANQTQMVVVNQLEPIFVQFTIPEKDLARVMAAQKKKSVPVTANIADQGLSVTDGALTFIDNTVDLSSGVIQMKAQFPNTTGQLWPGEFVRVILKLGEEPNAIVVPNAAVVEGQKGKYVFVVKDDMTVEARNVTEDRVIGDLAVISKGLANDETVVTDGQINLAPGAKIIIKESNTQTNSQGGVEK
ncbi:MAG: efflux RND transporter periplasmic adaptor subunit [Acholeplasmataceae bacterium]|nr:efflux RND transporter periplasmic adaptor subunit [Acholeplasmataceae bacterium]